MPYGMDWDEFKPNGYSGLGNVKTMREVDPVAHAVSVLRSKGVDVQFEIGWAGQTFYLVDGETKTGDQLVRLAKS